MRLVTSIALSVSLSLLTAHADAQQVTSRPDTLDIPNNAGGTDTFAGGARIRHTINTRGSTSVRDFHICVAETIVNGRNRVVKFGDPINSNFRASPGTIPAGWAYRGVQSGTPVVNGKKTTRKWYVTFVKTTPGGVLANAALGFSFDYKGARAVGQRRDFAIFTSDGNNNADNGKTGRPQNATTLVSLEPLPLHDVSITSFTATVSIAGVGYNITLCNDGPATPNFQLALYLNRANEPTCADFASADAAAPFTLAADSCQTLSVPVPGLPAGNYQSWIVTNADCKLPESDDTNNAKSATYVVR